MKRNRFIERLKNSDFELKNAHSPHLRHIMLLKKMMLLTGSQPDRRTGGQLSAKLRVKESVNHV